MRLSCTLRRAATLKSIRTRYDMLEQFTFTGGSIDLFAAICKCDWSDQWINIKLSREVISSIKFTFLSRTEVLSGICDGQIFGLVGTEWLWGFVRRAVILKPCFPIYEISTSIQMDVGCFSDRSNHG